MKFYELCKYIWQNIYPRVEEINEAVNQAAATARQAADEALAAASAAGISADAAVEEILSNINDARALAQAAAAEAEARANDAQAHQSLAAQFSLDASNAKAAAESAAIAADESEQSAREIEIAVKQYDAFRDIDFISEDNVVKARKTVYNADTQTETSSVQSLPIAVAGSLSGLMPKESLAALNQAIDDIQQLQGSVSRFNFDLGATPSEGWTQTQLTAAYYAASQTNAGDPIPSGTILFNAADPSDYEYQYAGTSWIKRQIGVKTATNDAAGLVKGSTATGKAFAETDGTLSLNGFDSVSDTANNAASLAESANAKISPLSVTTTTSNTASESGHTHALNLSARSVSAGAGLTGGGNLSADRTIALGTPSTITASSANSATGQTHTHAIDLSAAGYAVAIREVSAGAGLTGGGNLSADRTIALGTPSTIATNSANSASGTTHTHALNTSGLVLTSGAQTINGVKTFSAAPVFDVAPSAPDKSFAASKIADITTDESADNTAFAASALTFPALLQRLWRGITGLRALVANKVTKTDAETIAGVKTFSSEPVLPSKSTAAGDNPTKPATEAQVYAAMQSGVPQLVTGSVLIASKVANISSGSAVSVAAGISATIRLDGCARIKLCSAYVNSCHYMSFYCNGVNIYGYGRTGKCGDASVTCDLTLNRGDVFCASGSCLCNTNNAGIAIYADQSAKYLPLNLLS